MDAIISYGGALLVIGTGSALLFCIAVYLLRLERRAQAAVAKSIEAEAVSEWKTLVFREAAEEIAYDRDRLNAILSSIGEGIIVLDLKREVVLMNQVAGIMLRSAPAEAVGKQLEHVCDLVQLQKRTRALELRHELLEDMFRRVTTEAAIEAARLTDNLYCRKLDGTTFPVSFIMAPLLQRSGTVGGAIFVFRDVTEEKRVDEAKSEFVSLASHQLRTPLSTIGVDLEMLQSTDGTPFTQEQTAYITEMQEAVRTMTGLIVDLLEVSRIELGLFETARESVDVVNLFDEQLVMLGSAMRRRNIHVERQYSRAGMHALTSRRRVQIIIQNLLSNAIKYTAPGGMLVVKFEEEKDDFLFSVRDTGWGIPQREQSRIFERFFRASNAKKYDPSGTGLGLYITKRFVENLGGKIWFESEKDHGTVFYVRLPKTGEVQQKEERKRLAVGVAPL
ncbi:MAG: ATP-binding protein [bacterium]|nr:ATP-binding protein [bacterium]